MMYEPQAGTFAARVVAHLKALPEGTELASAVLAEDLGQIPAQVCSLLATARDHGLLKARKKPGERVLLWSIGDGTPLQNDTPPEGDEEEGDGKPHKTTPPAAPGSVAASVFEISRGLNWQAPSEPIESPRYPYLWPDSTPAPEPPPQASSPVERPEVTPEPDEPLLVGGFAPPFVPDSELPHRRVRAGTAPYRCAAFSDGEFTQEKGGVRIVLDEFEFETLVHYLQRTLGWERAA